LLAYGDLDPLVSNPQSIGANGRVTKDEIWCYGVVLVVFYIWLNVLYDAGLGAFGQGAVPSSMMDWVWILGILIYQNMIHLGTVLFVAQYHGLMASSFHF
jgi:hypothetical protein